MRIIYEQIEKAHKRAKISLFTMYGAAVFISIARFNWFNGSETTVYVAIGLYFFIAGVTHCFIERMKKLINRKIEQTRNKWDLIEQTRHNWRNN